MFVLSTFDHSIPTTNRIQTFKARAAVIADQAHNPRGALGEGADFMRGLDENERQCKLVALPTMAISWLLTGSSVPRCA